jgi:hypothetical protein
VASSAHTLDFGALAAVLMGVFVVVDSRVATSIMPMRILQLRGLSASRVVRGLTFSSMFAVFFFDALILERMLGYGPLKTGITFLPMSLVKAAMSLGVSSRLLLRYGPMRLIVPGMSAVEF